MIKGRCECGSVQFEVEGARKTVTICHCSQCRRTSGHLWGSTRASMDKIEFKSDDGLKWYVSSDWAMRGFCENCGSSLFYKLNDKDYVGIAIGCLEDQSGFEVGKHIFVKDKGPYYAIADGETQIEKY